MMYSRLIIDGNAVYEIDDECVKQRQGKKNYGGKNRGKGGNFGGFPSDVLENTGK